jgi:uncharacterized protein (DUF58 family)
VNRLVPATVAAAAESTGRFAFGFGRRFFLLLALGLVWIAPAWREQRFLYALLLWNLMVFAMWAWDLRALPRPGEIEVRRIWKEPLGLARKTDVTIELHNSSRTAISADVRDEAPTSMRSDLPTVNVVVPGQTSASAHYSIEPGSRGDARFADAWLRYQGALRLAERWARAGIAQEVRVYPNLQEAQRNRIYLIRSRQIELEKRLRRQRGQGREFESLREYRTGDEFRNICWTATARRGKLITKIHQVERSQTIWLVLDAGRLMRARADGLTKLDYAVNAALSLAQVAFYSGDLVGMLAYGRKTQQHVGPGRGAAHLRVLLESLAQVRAESYEADHLLAAEALLAQQSRRCLIVWLTDLAETAAVPEVIECAATMAVRHLVVLGLMAQTELRNLVAAPPQDKTGMYRYSAALEIVQRREVLLRSLRQRGALVLEAPPNGLSTSLVNQYLDVKERSLL